MKHILILLFGVLFSGLPFLSAQASLVQSAGLFESEEMLELRLAGDTRSLFNDRSDDAVYHPMQLSYTDRDGERVSIPLKVKTRGNFRRKKTNCFYPPLLLNFSKANTPEGCLFADQDKLKLVTPCRDDQYVVREYLVYKLYNLLTGQSFRARLVRVIYEDMERNKDTDPLYGILLEDEDRMAARLNGQILKRNRVRPNKTDQEAFLRMAVFEYLIANTDWSVQYRHNVKLVGIDTTGRLITVPYDFDHAGIVNTPYARPAPELEMRSIRERRYRGYCLEDMSVFDPVIDLFNERREALYRAYRECDLLEEKYVEETIEFLDEFYATINDPAARAEAFGYPCDEHGTGNVVIKGLRGEE